MHVRVGVGALRLHPYTGHCRHAVGRLYVCMNVYVYVHADLNVVEDAYDVRL
jgi:hypothetical protein